jgi:hypothetical protein
VTHLGYIAFAIVAALSAIGYGVFAELQAQVPPPLPKYDARLIELDRQAIERAYTQQAVHLFQQWMKDDTRQPERMMLGLTQARSAYSQAMEKVEERERAK